MKRYGIFIVFVVLASFLLGCSGSSSGGGDSRTNTAIAQDESTTNGDATQDENANAEGTTSSNGSAVVLATAQLGNLASADVKIYRIENDGTQTLLWSETTSDANRALEDIGKFDLHADALDPKSFYLISVSGGEDWDANDDGIKDTIATPNGGTIRLIASGSDIIRAGSDLRVSLVSELVYTQVAPLLQNNFDPQTFATQLQQAAQTLLGDVDKNSQVDITDVLLFNPVRDRALLSSAIRSNIEKLLANIHSGSDVLEDTQKERIVCNVNDIAVSVDETKAFVSDAYNGIKIFDITDPLRPRFIKQYTDKSLRGYDKLFSLRRSRRLIVSNYSQIAVLNVANIDAISIDAIVPISDGIKTVRVAPDESTVFVGNHQKIYAIDITDVQNPVVKGTVFVSASGDLELTKDETKLLVCSPYTVSMKVVDVRDKANMQVVGSYGSSCEKVRAHANGTDAILFRGTNGIRVVDISDVNAITLKNDITTIDVLNLSDVTTSFDDRYMYFVGTDKTRIVNIQDSRNIYEVAVLTHRMVAKSIALSANKPYIFVAEQEAGLEVFDASSLDIKKVFVYRNIYDGLRTIVAQDGTKAFVADGLNGFSIVDIRDAANITKIGSYLPNAKVLDVAVSKDEKTAFIATTKGVDVLDVSNAANIVKIGSIRISNLGGIEYNDNQKVIYAVEQKNTATTGNMYVVDVTNKTTPQLINVIDTGIPYMEDAFLDAGGNYLYIASAAGVIVCDIANPRAVSVLNNVSTSSQWYSAFDIAVSSDGNTLYVSSAQGLFIVNVRDKTNPQIIGSNQQLDNLRGLALSSDETKVYVARLYGGVDVVDVTNKAAPTVIDTIISAKYAFDVSLTNNGADVLVTDNVYGFEIVDAALRNVPWKRYLEGKHDIQGSTLDYTNIVISADETLALLVRNDDLIDFFDITDKTAPRFIATSSTPVYSGEIVLSSDKTKMYTYNGAVLNIYSIAQSTATMNLEGSLGVAAGGTFTMELSADDKTLTIRSAGIEMQIDVSDATNPKQLTTTTNRWGVYIHIDANHIIADGVCRTFIVYDTLAGQTNATIRLDDRIAGYRFDGGTNVYVANAAAGVVVVDFSSIVLPYISKHIEVPGEAYALRISADRSTLYVATSEGFYIVDLSAT